MLNRIADKIKTALIKKNIVFSDTIEGLARPVKLTINKVEKTFPIAYDVNLATCTTDNLQNKLVPDYKKKSIIYFETVTNPVVVETHKAYNVFEATLRLVCWINYNKINSAYYEPSLLINEILKDMPTKIVDTMVKGTNITFNSQVDKSELFTAYSYPEAETQFITHPYDAFGLDFDIQYRISSNCTADTVINAACGN